MDWLSIDTDIADDTKIQFLINDEGPEGYGVWNILLTKVAKQIDIDNDKNGYMSVPGERKPHEFLALAINESPDRVEEIMNTCAELELIDPGEWEDDQIFLPKLLERDQVNNYLSKQKNGRKGGSKGKTAKRNVSERQANGKRTVSERKGGKEKEKNKSKKKKNVEGDKDVDKDKDKKNIPKEADASEKSKIDRGKIMGRLRNQTEETFSEEKAECVQSAFGNMIFNHQLNDKELKWILDNHEDGLKREVAKASNTTEVFQFFNQYLKSTVKPEMREARLWKEDDTDDGRVDDLIGSFTENHDIPDNDFNRQEKKAELLDKFD